MDICCAVMASTVIQTFKNQIKFMALYNRLRVNISSAFRSPNSNYKCSGLLLHPSAGGVFSKNSRFTSSHCIPTCKLVDLTCLANMCRVKLELIANALFRGQFYQI